MQQRFNVYTLPQLEGHRTIMQSETVAEVQLLFLQVADQK
jgi:hypothetical protein